MKSWKALLLLALGGILCLVFAGCGSSSVPKPVQLQLKISTLSLPGGTQNQAYTAPLVASGGTGPYTWSVSSGNLPTGLSLSSSGSLSGTPTDCGSSSFTVKVTDSAAAPATATASLSLGIQGVVTITTSSLPAGTVGVAYSAALVAAGGNGVYKWSTSSGTLPAGLALSSTGVISGTPASAGSASFTVAVADSETTPASAARALSITVKSGLTVTTASLPAGTTGVAYSITLAATGGTSPYAWTLLSGNLPLGLNLDSAGTISGTPTASGDSVFTVQVADAGSATATAQLSITVKSLTITTLSLPAGTLNSSYSATLAAVGGVQPYTWTLSGSLPAGLSLSADGVISGTPTATGKSNFGVQVADAEVPPATDSAQLSLTINTAGDPRQLNGPYAFMMRGFDASGLWTLVGHIFSDGNGNITSGVVDGNSFTGAPFNLPITGTYSITTEGLNTMTLQAESWGPMTIAFALTENGNGRLLEYDDANGQGSRGAGVLRKQDPSAFSLEAFTGTYVYGMAGVGNGAERVVNVGEFTIAGGNMTNGLCDINDGGTVVTCNFTGTTSAVDPDTGRVLVQTQSNNGHSNQAVYVVSATEAFMGQIDSLSQTGTPLLAGSVLQQAAFSGSPRRHTASYNNGALNGTTVLYYQDIHAAEGANQSGAMILGFDGAGNVSAVAADEDLAGVITQKSPGVQSYEVSSNGAVTFGDGAPIGFLIDQNKAFLVGTGASTLLAVLEPQVGGPFSNASVSGTLAGGSLAPVDYPNARNEVDMDYADGAGTLTLNALSSSSDGLGQTNAAIQNYTIDSNGRGVTSESTPAVFYVISPNRVVVLLPEAGADAIMLEPPLEWRKR